MISLDRGPLYERKGTTKIIVMQKACGSKVFMIIPKVDQYKNNISLRIDVHCITSGLKNSTSGSEKGREKNGGKIRAVWTEQIALTSSY